MEQEDKISKIAYFFHTSPDNTLAYHRVIGPAQALGIDVIHGFSQGDINFDCVKQGDIVLLQRDFPKFFDAYERILATARKEKKPVVLDLDDLLLQLPEEHPDRQQFAYTEALFPMFQALIEADMVTVSTEPLLEYVKKFNPNVSVLPNFLNDRLWTLREPTGNNESNGFLTIEYMGGNSHVDDLKMIAPTLIRLLERYPSKIRLRFLGVAPPSELISLPQCKHVPLHIYEYPDFAATFQEETPDIFIAPLMENLFNSCKSAIKFLEYSALGTPGVYSDILTYSNAITHGYDGLLASTPDQWLDHLSELIENSELRIEIARNAQDTIRNKWLLSNNAHLWLGAYERAFAQEPSPILNKDMLPVLQSIIQQSDELRNVRDQNTEHLENQVRELDQRLKLLKQHVSERDRSLQKLREQLSERNESMQELTEQLLLRDQSLQMLREQLSERDESTQGLTQQLLQQDQQLNHLKAHLTEQDKQVQSLTEKVSQSEGQAHALTTALRDIEMSRAWELIMLLRRIRYLLLPPGSLRVRFLGKIKSALLVSFSPERSEAIDADLTLIRSSGMFDEAWYLSQYQDVANAKVDPARHFLVYGGFEGRDPGLDFSSSGYITVYHDVKMAGINPLVHYLKHGKGEGRSPKPADQALVAEVVDPPSQGQFEDDVCEGEDTKTYRNVSIIIPVHNGLAMTMACIDSIYANTKNIDFEIIIIDNASEDETPGWLESMRKEHDTLTSIRMAKNVGFGPAVNKGIQESSGRFLVVLNNDTLVTSNWLENLLSVMESDPTVGIVSPVTNYVGEGSQIDLDAQELQADPELISEYAKSIALRSEVFYEPNRLVFFCVLIRREVIDFIGYLDEGYIQGNFEDDDFCLRTRIAGYQLAIAKNTFVYHHGSATFKDSHISHHQWMGVNRSRFYEKVGRIATTVQPRGSSLYENKDGISVIIRTKDRPGLLKNALSSLTNQTIDNIEVVVVNDGGEDISSQIQFFESYFPLAYVLHDEPKGRASAINTGVATAKGEWIAFLDDDDILYPWHLETLFRAAETSGAKFVYSDFNRALFANSNVFFPMRLIGAPPWEYSRKELLVQNFLPIHTWIHKRECYQEAGPWDEELDRLEDYDYLLRLSSLYEFKHVRKVTCEYRYYLNISSSITSGRMRYLDALRRIYQKFPLENSDLDRERKMILDLLNKQVEIIQKFVNSSDGSPEEEMRVYREIIRLVAGL